VLPKDTEGYIVIVQLRDLSYEDAEKEILEYLQNAGKRKVYISEIVKKLRLDIELVADILHKWRDKMCKDLCEEDGFADYTSYECPAVDCIYNNYLVM
jgi:hypothetical protein